MTGTLRAVRKTLPSLVWLCSVCNMCGCAGAEPARVPDPRATATAFSAAAARGDAASAWALLDPALRGRLDRAEFERKLADNRAELQALAEGLARVEPSTLAQAEVELTDGERVLLVLEDGEWHLAGGVLDAQALETPAAAVIALRHALARQSLPALLRVLSAERRAAWLAAFEQSMERTADPLDLEIDVHGDEAVVHLREGGEIHLKREAGRWQVWDVR